MVCKRVLLLSGISNKGPKPKQCLSALTGTTKTLQQAARIMKLIAVLLLGACLHVHATGYGQKISLSERDVPLEKVFKKIQEQTKYKFLYTSQLLEGVPKVTISVKNASLEEVLDLVFKDQKLDYEINENTIVVRPKVKAKGTLSQEATLADPINVSGKVTDNEGRPLPGANVKVRGTNIGVTTDNNGNFSLKNISENAVLEITFVGHEMKTFTVRGAGFVNIALDQKLSLLDETVVIAYGTTTRRFSTGNVATVKATEIEKQPVMNPLLALQGRVPGLYINQINGLPGGGIDITIQGINSIGNGSKPFYVIDGIPYPSEMLSTVGRSFGNILGGNSLTGGSGNPLSYINPSDIESIDILKDADATAIYGSRGANGAILITTKKGKSGEAKVEANIQKGWGKVTSKLKLLNTSQYLEMRKEGKLNDNAAILSTDYDINGFWDTTRNTDWQKELMGNTAQYMNLYSSLTGGNKGMQYLLSGTYQLQSSVFPGKFRDRKGNFHFSLNSSSKNEKFNASIVTSYLTDFNSLPASDLTGQALTLAPNAPYLYNLDGSLNWEPNSAGTSTWSNPLKEILKSYENKTTNLIANSILTYRLTSGLYIKSGFGFNKLETNEYTGSTPDFVRPESRPSFTRSATYSFNANKSWSIEPQISYLKEFNSIKFDFLIGATWQETNNNGLSLIGSGYSSDAILRDLRSAVSLKSEYSDVSLYRYNAFFGRANFNFLNRYILNLSARRDGSSRFGEQNRMHNFWSIGAAWIFSETKLFKDNFSIIKFGKIKFSYGTSGNDQFSNYKYLNLYNVLTAGIPYQSASTLYPTGHSNSGLQWELTKKLMAGVDLAFWNERINVSASFVNNRSGNQLVSYVLPALTGFEVVAKNFPALVQNREWQLVISSANLKSKKLSWKTEFNITISQNKLVAFPDLNTSSYATSLVIGQSVSILKKYKYLGVDQQTGKYQVADVNGEPTANPVEIDKTEIINTSPKLYGGLTNNIRYGNLEMSFLFQFTKRIATNYFGGSAFPGFRFINQPITVLQRWQKTNDNQNVQYFSSNGTNAANYRSMKESDAAYSDASFIRLKNISLSFELPELNRLKLKNTRVFINAQNLFTITRFDGLDPETGYTALPPLKIFVVGAHFIL